MRARCSATLTGPARRARAERGQQRVRAQPELRAEAAADVGRHDADLLLRDAERLAPCRPRVQAIIWFEVQSVSWSPSHAAMRRVRLHHRVRFVRRRVGRVELHGRRGEGAGEVADRGFRRPRRSCRRASPMSLTAARSNAPFAARVLDAHEVRRRARLLERLGHDDRDRLVVVLDLRAAEQPRGVEVALAELAGVLRPSRWRSRRARPSRRRGPSRRCGPWRWPSRRCSRTPGSRRRRAGRTRRARCRSS